MSLRVEHQLERLKLSLMIIGIRDLNSTNRADICMSSFSNELEDGLLNGVVLPAVTLSNAIVETVELVEKGLALCKVELLPSKGAEPNLSLLSLAGAELIEGERREEEEDIFVAEIAATRVVPKVFVFFFKPFKM